MEKRRYYKGKEAGVIGINEACIQDDKVINIIMEPYKAKVVIEELMNLNTKKRFLYLTFRDMVLSTECIYEKLIFDNFEKISKSYDFIIIDDISFYSNYNKAAVMEIVDLAYKMAEKILVFSIDVMIPSVLKLYMTTQTKETHFKEPRIIVTRFDLRERIPAVFYTYLEWFNSKDENVIIYVEEEKARAVYHKFMEFEKSLRGVEVILYEGCSVDLYRSMNERRNSIIIHSNIQALIDNIKNTNVIMYNDNKDFYSYKEVVFLCGRYSVLQEKKELILLSKKESINIDKAKDIARLYNEIPWRDE